MESCMICMMESDLPKKCCDSQCECMVCAECLDRFLEICLREQNVPRCLSPNCNSLYLRNQAPFPKYDLALFRGLLKDPSLEEKSKIKNKKQAMFQEIVEDRRKTLEESFPVSIQKAVQIMYSAELKRIAKSNQESIDTRLKNLHTKRCFRLFCRGVMTLDGQWNCGTCETRFCADCESRWEGNTHQCKEEELASVEWKKALPHCPKCNQPIEKKDGCNFMTCAACQQNFCYSTGEVSQAGNHGKSVPVQVSNESFDRLWSLFPPLDARSAEQKKLARELQIMQKDLEEEKIKVTDPTWDWKPSDVSLLNKWISSSTESDSSKEEKMAKMVAQRVEKFEQKRQHVRDILRRLKNMEDFLLS